jgi:PAS domain S-box-containing protein
VLVTVLLAVGGYAGFELRSSHRQIEGVERERLEQQAQIVESLLAPRLQAMSSALESLRADAPGLLSREDSVSLLSERMQGMVSATTGVRTFALVNAEGTIVASNRRELIGSDWRNGVPYREISAHPDSLALYISPPYTTRLGSWAFSLGRAIVDRKGGFDGYVLAIIDPGYFSPLFESTRHTSDTSTAMIHGGGTVIYRVPDPESSVGMNLAELPDSLFSKHIQSGRDATSWTGVLRTTGREALIVFQTIRPSTSPSDGFLVASFGRETSAIFAPWRRELKDRVALLVVVVLASALGLYFSQRSRAVTARFRAEREAERRKAEEALRASEERQRKLFDNLDAGIVVHAPDTSIVQCNRRASVLLGLTSDQMAGKVATDPGWRFVAEDGTTLPVEQYPVARVLATRAPVVDQVVGIDRPATGDRKWALVNAYPEFDEGRELRQIVVTFVDITRRVQAEEMLRVSEQRHRLLAENARDVVWTMSTDGTITYVSPSVEKVRGFTPAEAMRQSIEEIHTPASQAISLGYFTRLQADLQAGRPPPTFRGELEYRCKDGSTLWTEVIVLPIVDSHGAVREILGVTRDLSERKRTEEAMRLAGLGTLVTGVAHEINNPLSAEMADQGVALEVVREVRERLRGDSPVDRRAEGQALDGVVEALEDAQEGGARIARIVKDLGVFGKPDAKRQRARLMDVIDGAMRWLPSTVAGSASIRVENGGAPDIIASVGQIEQVLVNLVTNAAKATPEGQRGTIIVRVGPGLPGTARVEVVDHGVGVDPSIRDHIFDPFFTTRPAGPGRGSGLGLAISHAIVTAHGGTLTVESVVGKGSTFRVELPIAHAEA